MLENTATTTHERVVEQWYAYDYYSMQTLHCQWMYTDIIRDYFSWWRHHMKTFSAFLALCTENSRVTDKFPSQRLVARIFNIKLNFTDPLKCYNHHNQHILFTRCTIDKVSSDHAPFLYGKHFFLARWLKSSQCLCHNMPSGVIHCTWNMLNMSDLATYAS